MTMTEDFLIPKSFHGLATQMVMVHSENTCFPVNLEGNLDPKSLAESDQKGNKKVGVKTSSLGVGVRSRPEWLSVAQGRKLQC